MHNPLLKYTTVFSFPVYQYTTPGFNTVRQAVKEETTFFVFNFKCPIQYILKCHELNEHHNVTAVVSPVTFMKLR